MNSENTGGESTTEANATVSENTTESGQGETNASFDFGGWNGNRDSLPNEHHAVFDAIKGGNKTQEVNTQLRDYLKSQIYSQEQQNPVGQNRQAQDDESPLTRDQAMNMFREEEASRRQRETIESFRSSLLDVVSKPNRYGDATVAFASESEVDNFKKFVSERLNGGLTAQDMLLLYKQSDIFQQLKDSAVKGFERKLKTNRPSDVSGDNVETRSSNIQGDSSGRKSRPGKAPRTAELLQANNPELYQNILNGKADLF